MKNIKLYAVRDTDTGKLVSNITSPGHKFWHRQADAERAIRNYNSSSVRYRHGTLKLVVFELVEVEE